MQYLFHVSDPDKDACFGSGLARYIRREVIGVEDLLRNSFKVLAFEEDKKQGTVHHNTPFVIQIEHSEHSNRTIVFSTTSLRTILYAVVLLIFSCVAKFKKSPPFR